MRIHNDAIKEPITRVKGREEMAIFIDTFKVKEIVHMPRHLFFAVKFLHRKILHVYIIYYDVAVRKFLRVNERFSTCTRLYSCDAVTSILTYNACVLLHFFPYSF